MLLGHILSVQFTYFSATAVKLIQSDLSAMLCKTGASWSKKNVVNKPGQTIGLLDYGEFGIRTSLFSAKLGLGKANKSILCAAGLCYGISHRLKQID